MIFVTAGMGGGTGTGAAAYVAHLARRQRALTVGVVTLPFAFEGARRQRLAREGVEQLRQSVDALIVIPNDRLLSLSERNTSMVQAFRRADDLLRQGVQGVAELVTVTGTINLDFADVRSVMEDAGRALMAVGEGMGREPGPGRRRGGGEQPPPGALHLGGHPLAAEHHRGPGPHPLRGERDRGVRDQGRLPDASIIFGHVVHPRPEVEVRVTLIATGMPDEPPPARGTSRSASRPPPVPPSGTLPGRHGAAAGRHADSDPGTARPEGGGDGRIWTCRRSCAGLDRRRTPSPPATPSPGRGGSFLSLLRRAGGSAPKAPLRPPEGRAGPSPAEAVAP